MSYYKNYFCYIKFFKKVNKDRKLGFDPTQMSWFSKGEYILITGSNRQCGLYTKEGVKLGLISEKDSWILCAKNKPDSNFVVHLF
jgi:intraflagellar transport protein 122